MPIQQFDHSRRHAHLLLILMAALLSALAGCGMYLRADPASSAGSSIAGQWQLQTPARAALAESMRAVMKQANAKQDSRDRKEFARRPESDINLSPPDTDGDTSNHPRSAHDMHYPRWEVRERKEQQEALLNAILPSEKLQILQSANRIEFIPVGAARRSFDRAETSTLVTSYASLHVESGWQDNVFIVHSKDSARSINIVERYQRLGDQLHMQVQLDIPDAKKQTFDASYTLTHF